MLKNHLEVNVGTSFIAAIAISIALGYFKEYIMTFIAIFIHEMSHVGVAALLGEKVDHINIMAVGLNAEIKDVVCEKNKKLAIYLSGPAMNVLMAVILYIIGAYYLKLTNNMHFFVLINLYIAVFNLVPILPLDGGKILEELLVDRIGIYSAHTHIIAISRVINLLTIIIGILQLYFSKHNLSLLITGIYIFLNNKCGKVEVGFMNIKNVVYRRSRLLKKGVYPARDLVVMKWLNLGDIIKSMDYDRFHIVHVLDENLNVIKTLTEQEIIDGMLNNEGEISFDEFIKLSK